MTPKTTIELAEIAARRANDYEHRNRRLDRPKAYGPNPRLRPESAYTVVLALNGELWIQRVQMALLDA